MVSPRPYAINRPKPSNFPKKRARDVLKAVEKITTIASHPQVVVLPLKEVEGMVCVYSPTTGSIIPFPRNYFEVSPIVRRNFWLSILKEELLSLQHNSNEEEPTESNVGKAIIIIFANRLDVILKIRKGKVA